MLRLVKSFVFLTLFLSAASAFGQKAGIVTKYAQPAMILQPAARSGLPGVTTALTAPNTRINWLDTLVTEEGGRIRAQLNDGSILSIGSKSKLVVKKHDEKSQQSEFDLAYGKVRSQVVHLARPESSFEVRTNTAVCGVLGTDDIVDAENPTATVVIVITGVVTVRSSNPNVVGSVQLTAGQTTTVTGNQPPTQPTTASVNQVSNSVTGTTGSVDPEPTVNQGASQLQAGQSLTLDGRSSSGGLGSIASYQWTFTPNPFVGSVRQPDLTQPTLSLDTTGWAAGAYTGRLTVTNTVGKSAIVNFNFSVAPSAIPIPPPDATVTALAAAYEALQVRSFMNLFDPNKYTGYAALEQSITQSFSNIQSNRVFVQKAAGQTSGSTAILQVNFTTKFTPKNTALASPGLSPGLTPTSIGVPVRAFARPSAGTTLGSISGSAGAVATFIIVSGPTNTGGVSPNNSLNYTVANLQNGSYTVTPVRNGFTFTPVSRTVVIANGAAITGVDFTAQPQEQTVNEQATLRMELQGAAGSQNWVIVDIQGGLGSAGLVGIPGTSNPVMINTPGGQGSNAGGGDNTNVSGGTPTFSVASATTYNVFQGGSNAATPAVVTLTPTSGFSGNVAMAFTPPPGVTLVSGPSAINIAAGAATATGSYVFSAANTVSGLIAVPYTATSGTIVQGGFIVLNVQGLSIAVTGAGQTAGTPLQVFSGNSATATVALTPAGTAVTYTATPNVAGVTASVTPSATGGTVNITSTDSASGPVTVAITATAPGGGTATATVFVTRVPPVSSGLGLSVGGLAVSAGAPGAISVNVPFNGNFPGPVTVTAPVITGFAFSPTTITLTQSGNANFTVTATGAQSTLPGTFTVAAGAYRATLTANFTIGPPFDFTLTPSSLTLTQATTASVGVVVNETGGAGPTPVVLTVSGLPAGITAVANGASSVTGNGSVSFNVSASATAALGAAQFTVTGTGGGVTHSVIVPLTITTAGSFTLNVTPSTVNVFDGGTGSVSVAVQTVGPFTGSVAITSASGVAQASGPASITAGSSASYTVTTTGAGTLTFTGTSQGIVQTAPVSVALVPGFTLTATSASGFDGGSASVAVTVNRIGNFAGAVVVTPSASGGFTFSPTSALVAAGSNTANFTVTIPNTASSSTLNFSGVAQGGSIAVTTSSNLSLNTPFSLTSSTVTGFNGQTVQITVPVVRSPGFTGTVTVTPAGGPAGVIITPSSVSVDPNTSQATFVASIPANATSGTVNFNGTSSGLPQTANAAVTLTISAPFSLTLGGSASAAVVGTTVQTTANVTLLAGFSGPVALSTSVVGVATAQLTNQQFSASGSTPLAISTAANSTPGTSVVTVTATAGSFTLTASYTLNTQVAFSTQQNTPPNFTIFRGYGASIAIGVTYGSAFTGGVSATVVTPSGIAAAPVAPISATGPIVVQLSAAQVAQSGQVMVTLSGGGNTITIPYTVTVADPYTLSTVLPVMPAGSTAGSYTVGVTAASGFNGSVTVTPAISATGGTASSTIGQPKTISISSGQTTNATFPLTIGGGVSSINLSALTTSGGFTLSQPVQQVSVGAAFTMSASTGVRIFSGVGTQFSVTVNYATGYTGSVTVTPPSGAGIASFLPSSAVATPGSPTVNFIATGTASNPSGGSSSITIAGSDGQGNNGSTSMSYSYVDPYSLSTVLPAMPAGSTAGTYGVRVTAATGFNGSVTITPAISATGGTATSNIGTSQTITVSSGGTTTANFALTIGGGVSNINLSATTTTSSFTLNQASQQVAVGAAFTMSATSGYRVFSGVGTQFSVTVNYATGYTGSVTVQPPASPGIQSFVPSSAVATPGNPTVTFVATGLGSNPTLQNGSVTINGFDAAGNTGTTTMNYTYVDPFSLTSVLPTSPIASTTNSYSVTVVGATGFSGTVTIKPTVQNTGGTGLSTIGGMQTVNINGNSQSANFAVTINGGATSISLGETAITGSFSLTPTSQSVNVGAAFGMTNSGPLKTFSGVGQTFTVTVQFASGFVNSVTVTPGSGSSIASYSPTSAVATPGSPTVTFTATGTSSNVSMVNSSATIAGTDGVGDTATSTLNYSVIDPYTISTVLPSMPAGSTTGSYQVTLSAANGFNGNVTVTPAVTSMGGTGSPSISGPQTKALTSLQNTLYTFTVTINGGVTGITLSAATGTGAGGFTLTQAPQNVTVAAAYTLSNSGQLTAFSGVPRTFTVTVNYASGYTGLVSLTPSIPPGLTAFSPVTGTATPSNPTVTFTATGSSTNPTIVNGNFLVGANDGAGNNGSTQVNYSVIDPYTIATTLPTSPADSTSANYRVSLTAANGFSGTVGVTAVVTGVGGIGSPTISAPQALALVSGQVTQFNFNVGVNGGATSINLSATTAVNSFSLNVAPQAVTTVPAFTMTNGGTVTVFTGQSTQETVTVVFASGYTNPVTITPPSPPTGVASIGPSTVTVTPSNPTATFTVNGPSSLGSPRSGTLTFTAADSAGNSGSTSPSYTSNDPYSLTATLPSTWNASATGTFGVVVHAAVGYSGTVNVTANVSSAGCCAPSTISGGQTVTVTGGGTATANFTVTNFGGTTSLTLGATASISNFSTSISPPQQTVGAAYTLNTPATTTTFTGFSVPLAITVTFPANSTLTAVPVTVVNGTGMTVSPSVLNVSPANPTATFQLNGVARISSNGGNYTVDDSQGDVRNGTFIYKVVDPYSVALSTATQTAFTVPLGGTNQAIVNVTYAPGFTGTVEVTLPSGTGFTVSQPSMTVTGTGAAVFTIAGTSGGGGPVTGYTISSGTPSVSGAQFAASNLTVNFNITTLGLSMNPPATYFIADNRPIGFTLIPNPGTGAFLGTVTYAGSVPVAPFTGFAASGSSTVNLSGGGSGTINLVGTSVGTPADAGAHAPGTFNFTLSGSPNMQGTYTYSTGLSLFLTAPYTQAVSVLNPSGGNNVYVGSTGTSSPNNTLFGVSITGTSGWLGTFNNTVNFAASSDNPLILPCAGTCANGANFSQVISGPGVNALFVSASPSTVIGATAGLTMTTTWSNGGGSFTLTSAPLTITAITAFNLSLGGPNYVFTGNATTVGVGISEANGVTGTYTVTFGALTAGIGSLNSASSTSATVPINAFFSVTGNASTTINGFLPLTASVSGIAGVNVGTAYTSDVPFTASLDQSPIVIPHGQTFVASGNVNFTTGFSGTVTDQPAGTGGTSGSLPTNVVYCNATPTSFNFNATASHSQIGCYTNNNTSSVNLTTPDAFVFTAGTYTKSLSVNVTAQSKRGRGEGVHNEVPIRSGGFDATPGDLAISPASPRAGDAVTFRWRVTNQQATDGTVKVSLMRGSKVIDQQTVDIAAGASQVAKLAWTAETLGSDVLSLRIGDDGTMPITWLRLDSGALRRDRVSISARNENCTGVRIRSASQSSCSGSSDLQIQPVISPAGRLDVQVSVDGGGLRDVGPASSLPTTADAMPDASSTSPQGLLEQGHMYLVTSRGRVSMVRVVRIRSSVNPKLAAVITPRNGRQDPGDVLGGMREQRQADQILTGAQIQIDLEWVTVEK